MGSDQKLAALVVDKKKVMEDERDDEPLSPASRLFHQPRFNCYIISIMGSGKKFDVDVVKAGVQATLIRHPRFSSLQVLDGGKGEAKWVRTTVAVENHIVVPDFSDVTITSPDQFVEDYISNLSTTTLDFSKPLWDLHLLNVRTSEAEAVGVLRCHHSLGDGVALMSLLLACFRRTSDNTSLPTISTVSKRKEEGGKKRNWGLISVVVAALIRVFMVVRVMWNTFVDVLGFVSTASWLKDTETPIKMRKGVKFNKKRFVHRTLLLDDIKFVKYTMDSTVNDVLLAITSAGLTRYLSRKYGCDGVDGKGKLPDNIRIRSTVLVNIRKAPGIHALADMMAGHKENVQMGNCIGYIILPFPIVQRKDPLDYVYTAKKIANRKKASYEAFFTFSSAKLVLKLFGIKAASSLSHKLLSNTTLSFSNIIGPLEEVCFYGHPLVYIAPTVYGHPHSLTLHFQSYMGKMKMVLAADETVIPDPHQLCTDIADYLDLMKKSAMSRASALIV